MARSMRPAPRAGPRTALQGRPEATAGAEASSRSSRKGSTTPCLGMGREEVPPGAAGVACESGQIHPVARGHPPLRPAAQRTPCRTRVLGARLALAVGGFCLAFLAGEVVFRIHDVWARPLRPWTEPHPQLGYLLKRDLPWVNSLGIRERPVTPKRGRRLLVLGDSVAWGGGERSFPRLLEQRIGASAAPAGAGIEVFNAGIPGYTTYQEVTWYELFGHRLRPDVVVLQFCLNDVYRILHTIDDYGRLHIAPEVWADFEGPFMGRWIRSSHFLSFVMNRSYRLKRAVSVHRERQYTFEARADFYRAWGDDGWIEIRDLVSRLRGRATRDGGTLAVVVFPFGQQLREDYLQRDRAYVLKPQGKLREIADHLHIPLLDLFATFRGHREYLPDDIHASEEARAVVAEELYRFLRRQGLLRAAPSGQQDHG